MKKFLFLGVVTFFSTLLFAQNTNQNLLSPIGNVGIGTTSPTEKLSVHGNSEMNGRVLIKEDLILEKLKENVPSQVLERYLIIDREGKVGKGEIIHPGGNPIGGLSQNFWSQAGNNNIANTDFIGSTNNAPLIFRTNNVERMRIHGNETKVGIGTNDPKKALHIVTLHSNVQVDPNDPTPHHSHYGIRLEDRTSLTGNSSIVKTTIWDIEPYNKNLVIGKPLEPFVTFTDDYNLDVNGDVNVTGRIKVGTSSLYIKGYSVGAGGQVSSQNSIYCDGGSLFINRNEGQGTLQNTIINPDGGIVGVRTHTPHAGTLLHIGDLRAITFGRTGGSNSATYGEFIGFNAVLNSTNPATVTKLASGTSTGGDQSGGVIMKSEHSGEFTIFAFDTSSPNGEVNGIVYKPQYTFNTNGTFKVKGEVVVEAKWSDYVFEEDYSLMSIPDLEKYLIENNHMPNVPSAAVVESEGLSLGHVQSKMMEKIEEQALYIIELHKRLENLEKEVIELSKTK